MSMKKASVLVEMTGALLDAGDKLIRMANHADRLMDITPGAVRATQRVLKARKELLENDQEHGEDCICDLCREARKPEFDPAYGADALDADFEEIDGNEKNKVDEDGMSDLDDETEEF
jgi:hypothetical protein